MDYFERHNMIRKLKKQYLKEKSKEKEWFNKSIETSKKIEKLEKEQYYENKNLRN
ncbi:hypothetical protein [Sigmofec virus UA08Rod_6125]|uniref:Uncharacterized protein n=1 Tax=Sigmofec virus UA08Rod_6125 TaxID=2929454 RepID=A0A976N0D1_9VIRU|nr:hypothetical protein [Sigmofec virus UA08Rod_6125]